MVSRASLASLDITKLNMDVGYSPTVCKLTIRYSRTSS